MATVIEIVNAALVQLGSQGGLGSLTDTGAHAQQANQVYTIARDALLACHAWNFAMARAEIDADVDGDGDAVKPAFGWSLQYTLPADTIRAWRLNDAPVDRRYWEIEGGKLLTNEASPIHLRYIKRVTDAESFPPLFADALSWEIAARLALPITQSQTTARGARDEARRALADAKWADSQEKGKRRQALGDLERAKLLTSESSGYDDLLYGDTYG